jgi:hypothetical protein
MLSQTKRNLLQQQEIARALDHVGDVALFLRGQMGKFLGQNPAVIGLISLEEFGIVPGKVTRGFLLLGFCYSFYCHNYVTIFNKTIFSGEIKHEMLISVKETQIGVEIMQIKDDFCRIGRNVLDRSERKV